MTDRSIINGILFKNILTDHLIKNMPRTPQQFEGIREEKKGLIMRTALELFARGGYHGTTISSIAREAGISKGLMYNYFESKEELMKEIIFTGLDSIGNLMDPDHDGVVTEEELEYLLDRFFELLQEDVNFWKLYFTLLVQEPIFNLVKDKFARVIRDYIALLESYFKSRGSEDSYTEALLFGALLDGIAMNYIANSEIFPVEKIKQQILNKYR